MDAHNKFEKLEVKSANELRDWLVKHHAQSESVWLVVIGCLGSATQLTLSQAFKEGDPTLLMPFDYVKLIWGIVFGFWLFGEVPDVFTWIGGTIIFVSGVLIAMREKKSNAKPAHASTAVVY